MVAALGVGDDKLVGVVGAYVRHYLGQGGDAVGTQAFKKCQVGFVGHAVGGCGVDYGLAEGGHALAVATGDTRRQLLDVGVETHA